MRSGTQLAKLAFAAALVVMAGGTAIAKDKEPVPIPTPPSGKGQIVFFRTGTIMGAAMGCAVHEKGQKISSLGAGRYFVLVTDPGKHEYMVKSEAKDVLALEVEADETQYAVCKIKMGVMMGRPDLRPSSEAEFRKSGTDRLVNDDDMGPGPGALRAAEMAAALATKPATVAAPSSLPEAAPTPAAEAAPSPAPSQ